jgi:hypothetical protein
MADEPKKKKPVDYSKDPKYRGWLYAITNADEHTAKQGVSDDEHKKFMDYHTGTKEYQKAKETKAKGGIIDKYKKGGSVSKKKKKKPRGVGVAKRGW